jgi:Protein of unknown function (DUF3147)
VVRIKLSALKETKPHQYLVRFLFGGAATVLAGLVAKHYGPGLGGLFLAFPAIFPASVTLIESHEKERKGETGHNGSHRGRIAASIDSAGAALGCVGLMGFAFVLWRMLPGQNPWLVIPSATAVWAVISISLWELRKHRIFRRRAKASSAHRPNPHSAR